MLNTNTVIYTHTDFTPTKYQNNYIEKEYHTFKVGSLVVYYDNEGQKHLDIILAVYDGLEVRILTDGVVDYNRVRHALNSDLFELPLPRLTIKNQPEWYVDDKNWHKEHRDTINRYLNKTTKITKNTYTTTELEELFLNEIIESISLNKIETEDSITHYYTVTYYTN